MHRSESLPRAEAQSSTSLTGAARLTAGLAGLAAGAGALSPALAQEATATATPSSEATLDPIFVEATGKGQPNANAAGTGTNRLPGTVRETPQIINVVPAELMEQKRITSLEEALRSVPGVTLSTGEGRGGANGQQFRLRGLAAKGDVYLDGLRDFGVYSHDAFNTQSVEVIKGPSGKSFGVGNLGGVINQTTKKAQLGNQGEAAISYASGTVLRETLDINRQLSDTSALRFNLMNQEGDAADRDHVKVDRKGLAVDYGTGIGTDTEWHLGYEYIKGEGTPDMGQPMAQGSDGIYRPLQEYDVPGYDSSTSYVRSTDRDDTENHILTSTFRHEFAPGVTFTNDTRYSHYSRDFSATNPAACSTACLAALRAGTDQSLSYGAGGGMTYRQDGWGVQNLTTGQFDFTTFGLRHKAMVGLDLSYQEEDRIRGTWTGRTSNQTILNPQYSYPDATVAYDPASKSKSSAVDIGLILQDRVWFNDQLSVQAAARADYFRSRFKGALIASTTEVSGESEASRVSPSFSVIYEPTKDITTYFSLARTFRPLGTDIASAVNSFASETPSSDANYKPERADSIEIGGKMDLMGGKLGLSGAIFQIDKDNSYTISSDGEISSGFNEDGNSLQIKGFELGATGELFEGFSVNAAYAYLDGEVTRGQGTDAATVGNDAPGVSQHNLALWGNYAIPEAAVKLPGQLSVGAGITYASEYWADAANTALIPETVSIDAMIAYETDRYRVALNGYNLTDHQNYESAFSTSRAVPMAGTTFALTLSTRF